MENTPKHEQARTGALIWGTIVLAVAFSLCIVYVIKLFLSETQMQEFGWRIPLFIGLVNLVFSFWYRLKLMELSTFKPVKKVKVRFLPTFKVFLMTVPITFLFYINSVSSSLMIKNLNLGSELQSLFPAVVNVVFFIACLLAGYCADKWSTSARMLKKTFLFMTVFSVPIYALQDLNMLSWILVSQMFIIVFLSVALSCGPPVMMQCIRGESKAVTLGIGLNLGVGIFGGTSPMLVSILSEYGQAYVGLLMSFGGLCYFAALGLDKYMQPKAVATA